MASAQATGWRAGLPWGVAGMALGALLTVVALRAGAAGGGGGVSPGGEPIGPVGASGGGSPMAVPDISSMSPEERATRLYNRVMSLHAAGKTDSAEFFMPMALQAYQMLPTLDVDARYHIGVLELAGGDAPGALAQADSIRRLVPTHLFGFMLRARAYETQNNATKAGQAYRDFLKNEAAERAKQRPEYAEHAQNLDSFHTQAQERTSTKPGA